jgi:hypothetical protein
MRVLKFQGCETTEKFKKFIGDSNGMFVVEGEHVQEGGKVQWDKLYRLRHLSTNKYLTLDRYNIDECEDVDEMPEDAYVSQYRMVAMNDYKRASLFQFELIYSTLNNQRKELALQFLEKDSFFRLSTTPHEHTDVFWLRTVGIEANDEYVVEGHNFVEEIVIPLFTTVKKEENVFKLAKANPSEVRQTKFLISCMRTFNSSLDFLSIDLADTTQFKKEEFQHHYKRLKVRIATLEKSIYDLHMFCYNKLLTYISFSQEYGVINPFV